MITIPDVQNDHPSVSVSLSRVGIKGIRRTLHQKRGDEYDILRVIMDVCVDLPLEQKGIHMSRNIEAIDDIVENMVAHDICNIEDFCIQLVQALLHRHEYAAFADVALKTDYTFEKTTPSTHRPSQANYNLIAGASIIKKEGDFSIRKRIGVEVPGFMVCPCALEMIRTYSREYLKKLDLDHSLIESIVNGIPLASHSQRGISRIVVETSGTDPIVEAQDLIECVEQSVSSPTYELLKRKDEMETIISGHKNPLFVEDAVRGMLKRFNEKFYFLPDTTRIEVSQENFESIHSHNVFSEKICTLGELRSQLHGGAAHESIDR